MVRSFLITMILILSIPGSLCASQSAGQRGEKIPLGKQLEDLAPGPRIAYLKYLLREEGADPEVYFHLGLAFHESSKPDSAIFYYGKSIEVSPDYSKSYVNMGVIYDEQGKIAEALKMFEEGARANPDDMLAHAHAAFIRFQFKDYTRAWDLLSKALEIDPDHPQTHFYLAIFFWESQMYREALNEWEKVTELDQDGYLSAKAQENIILLQKAFRTPSGSGAWKPKE